MPVVSDVFVDRHRGTIGGTFAKFGKKFFS